MILWVGMLWEGYRIPLNCVLNCFFACSLSPQDLVKELVYTRTKLRSTEEEMRAVRGYLDNLLLRIMETNPTILSIENP